MSHDMRIIFYSCLDPKMYDNWNKLPDLTKADVTYDKVQQFISVAEKSDNTAIIHNARILHVIIMLSLRVFFIYTRTSYIRLRI